MTTPHDPHARTPQGVLHRLRRPVLTLSAVAAAALVAGCFGGGDDDPVDVPGQPAGGKIPDSALASSTAYTQFTLTTAQTGSETAEPLSADNVTMPPTSETDEPAPVT